MAKSYRRVGIRRDNNFSDISDRKKALNNLLDKLGTDIPGGTFISEDLEAIRGLFSIGLSAGEYRTFAGSTVRETNIDGTSRAAVPAITYQNRLEKFKVDSGEFPSLNGGNGPTANYFNADQVKFDTDPDVFVGLTTGPTIPSDNFWEDGNFVYSRKINEQSINAAGGVQWDGFFVPTLTGQYTFSSSSTLGFTADFEAEGYTTGIGTFKNYAGIGLTVTIDNSGGKILNPDNANDSVTILGTGVAALAPSIGIGMTLTEVTNAGRIELGAEVIGVSTAPNSPNTITITFDPENNPVDGSGALSSIKLERKPGDSISKAYTTHTLEKFRPYRIRYRFFVPEGVNPVGLEKRAQFLYKAPGATSSDYLRYQNLYSLDYDFSDEAKGEFNKFLNQSLLFGGNKDDGTETIGSETNSNGYVRVSTNKKIDIRYEPKTTLAQIERASVAASWTAGTKIISISDTTGIEIGNYVFSSTQGLTANINTPVRVTDVIINDFIVIDTPATNTRTNKTLTFVDHRGFVKRVTARSSPFGTNIIIINADTNPKTLGLRTGQLAIYSGSPAYAGITTNGANDQVSQLPGATFTNRRVYFYESRGLIDRGLATFCVPAETQCFVVTGGVNAGNTVLPTTSTANIQLGYRVLGFPFADGTTVQSKTANSLTLSAATIKTIAPESNYTATSSLDDKSLCCPPTDTSPPFEPTELGLETPGTFPDIKLNLGNVKFDNLIIKSPQDKNNISALNTALVPASANVLPILGGDGVTYNLLCV
tara:strand:+ start:3249 stop:5540 length:2292 start_codon:yes stop_codon:yes gene_type:complete